MPSSAKPKRIRNALKRAWKITKHALLPSSIILISSAARGQDTTACALEKPDAIKGSIAASAFARSYENFGKDGAGLGLDGKLAYGSYEIAASFQAVKEGKIVVPEDWSASFSVGMGAISVAHYLYESRFYQIPEPTFGVELKYGLLKVAGEKNTVATNAVIKLDADFFTATVAGGFWDGKLQEGDFIATYSVTFGKLKCAAMWFHRKLFHEKIEDSNYKLVLSVPLFGE